MTIQHLKTGKPEADRAADDAKTRGIVEAALKDIEARGDTAVREMSNRFDKYDRDSYRLSEAEIQALIAKVSDRDMADIRFAHDQVRNFAQAQRDS
ncbi:histidinol dehydrogenase, partial [Fluviibacterium sp. DFM31]